MRRDDAEAADKRMAELARLQVETSARLGEMRDMLAGRQAELHRAVNERLDSVTHHLSQSMTATRQHTADNLAEAQRAARGDRRRAEEHHRARLAGHLAAERALEQAEPRRLRPGPHGGDHPGRPAEGLLRVPVHALEPQPAGLRDLPARPAAAGDRREIPARGGQRLPRRQDRRRAQARGGAAARRHRQACRRHRDEVPDPRRDPGPGADVRAVGVGLCRAATTASTTWCRRRIAPRSSSSRRRC